MKITDVYTAPAGAMGRSSASSVHSPAGQTADRPGRVETEQKKMETVLESRVEAMRQELADLKARIALRGVASAD